MAVGARAMQEGGDSTAERITFTFRLATSRAPQPTELAILTGEFNDRRAEFQADPARAGAYLAGGGAHVPPAGLDRAELAAYAAVASLILNLDESISKS